MIMKIQSVFLCILIFCINNVSIFPLPSFLDQTVDKESAKQLSMDITDSMSDQELLGQVFLVGYFGSTPSKKILSWIGEKHIGGVKIFGRNSGDLIKLTESISLMQKTSSNRFKIPLIVATDQEGGWVRHIRGNTSITPGNLSIGASNIPYDAFYSGYYIGEELKFLGINMNFAPTVDVYSNPNVHVIGPRSFSENALKTARLSVAYYYGMKKAGIICTAKHFPGHGNTDKDSHGSLPVINDSLKKLWDRDLLPYRFLIKEDIPAIMSGHLSFPAILNNKNPASLSYFFLTEILKKKMGFKGMIVTDDLYMGGVRSGGMSTADICIQSIEAGNDFILLSHPPSEEEKVWEILSKRMKENKEFRLRVKDAALKVLLTKINYLKSSSAPPLYPDIDNFYKLKLRNESSSFFLEQACRSVTKIRGENIPLTNISGKKILLAGQYKYFLEEGQKRFPHADTFFFSFFPFFSSDRATKKNISTRASNYDIIIFCLANPNSLEVLKNLENSGKELIVFSTLTPVYLRETPWVKSALGVYSSSLESFKAGFGVLAGDYLPEGELPISILVNNN